MSFLVCSCIFLFLAFRGISNELTPNEYSRRSAGFVNQRLGRLLLSHCKTKDIEHSFKSTSESASCHSTGPLSGHVRKEAGWLLTVFICAFILIFILPVACCPFWPLRTVRFFHSAPLTECDISVCLDSSDLKMRKEMLNMRGVKHRLSLRPRVRRTSVTRAVSELATEGTTVRAAKHWNVLKDPCHIYATGNKSVRVQVIPVLVNSVSSVVIRTMEAKYRLRTI